MDWIHDPKNLLSWQVPEPKLSSRIVSDFSTAFHFEEKWRPLQTSAGSGYSIKQSAFVDNFQFAANERVSDLSLGQPGATNREYFLHGRAVLLRRNLKCAGLSPWIDFSRQIRREKNGVRIKERVVLKTSVIPITEIRSEKFLKLQKKIHECMQTAVVIFE